MDNEKLINLRNEINEIDDQILNLLANRSEVVSEIGKYKNKEESVVDLKREEKILHRLVSSFKGQYSKDTIIRIWRELFQASSKLQTNNVSHIDTKRSINSINIYKGGKSSLQGKSKIIKLSSNENCYGPSPYILKNLDITKICNRMNRYPEIDGSSLRTKIAKLNNINADRIVLGCGSDELLLYAALSFCQDGDEIIQAEHGFEMYPIISKIVGTTTKYAKEDHRFKLTVKSICDQITDSTKLIFIANPNNPTGNYLNKEELLQLMQNVPKNLVVVIDGAYAEYVQEENFTKGFSLAEEFENLILTRTFSKSYGLAGLRIGWCYSSKKVSNILNKVKGPFNTSLFSQQIAITALDDQNYINHIVKKNTEIKNWFEQELKKLNIKTLPSFGNFSFVESTNANAEKIFKQLLNDGIIVRQLHSYNLPNCLRITIGTKEEMELTINSLKKFL